MGKRAHAVGAVLPDARGQALNDYDIRIGRGGLNSRGNLCDGSQGSSRLAGRAGQFRKRGTHKITT